MSLIKTGIGYFCIHAIFHLRYLFGLPTTHEEIEFSICLVCGHSFRTRDPLIVFLIPAKPIFGGVFEAIIVLMQLFLCENDLIVKNDFELPIKFEGADVIVGNVLMHFKGGLLLKSTWFDFH